MRNGTCAQELTARTESSKDRTRKGTDPEGERVCSPAWNKDSVVKDSVDLLEFFSTSCAGLATPSRL